MMFPKERDNHRLQTRNTLFVCCYMCGGVGKLLELNAAQGGKTVVPNRIKTLHLYLCKLLLKNHFRR